MDIAYGHFYVENAKTQRLWFETVLGFQCARASINAHTHTEVVHSGGVCFLLSSPLTTASPVAHYLQAHPPGMVDLAFRVKNLEGVMKRAIAAQVPILRPIQTVGGSEGTLNVSQLAGWGDLRHTLIEQSPQERWNLDDVVIGWNDDSGHGVNYEVLHVQTHAPFMSIDHAVLNVNRGDLERAIAFYQDGYGFYPQQSFCIHTEYSALSSQVLTHPDGNAQLPINEPVSANSQIQDFLNHNRGAGIQHIALRTPHIVQAIAQLRQQGLLFLDVPLSYYEQLKERPGFQLTQDEWLAIATQEVLVDWPDYRPEAMLLQAFTYPIFEQPTFFFELIERQHYRVDEREEIAQGFGEGNFRALVEAIEREQLKRNGDSN